MKNFYRNLARNGAIIFLFFISSAAFSTEPPIKFGPGDEIKVYANNFCEFWSRIYISEGVDSLGTIASIGIVPCYPQGGSYVHYDSIIGLREVLYSDVGQQYSGIQDRKTICFGNAEQIFTYKISIDPQFSWCDTTILEPSYSYTSDSIVDAKVYLDQIVVIRATDLSTNFLIFDSTFTTILHSEQLNMIPKQMFIDYSNCNILGIDQNGAMVLKIYDLSNLGLIKDTILFPTYEEPLNFESSTFSTTVVTEPGDTCIRLTKFNWYYNTFFDTIIYSGSGAGVQFMEGGVFNFQPKSDSSGLGMDKQVFVYNYNTQRVIGIYHINKKLRVLSNPGDGYNSFQYVFAIPDSAQIGKYYVYTSYSYYLLDSGYVPENTVLFNADFRCSISVDEQEDSNIKWSTFPNPTNGNINLTASGLMCGKDYTIDVLDAYGRIMHQEIIHAKMNMTLPVENYKAGIYFIRIHTQRGMVSQKFLKLD